MGILTGCDHDRRDLQKSVYLALGMPSANMTAEMSKFGYVTLEVERRTEVLVPSEYLMTPARWSDERPSCYRV